MAFAGQTWELYFVVVLEMGKRDFVFAQLPLSVVVGVFHAVIVGILILFFPRGF